MPKGHIFTPEQRAAVVKAYAAGMKTEQIKAKFNVSAYSVRQWVRRAGVPLSSHKAAQEIDALKPQILKLYGSGMGLKAVAVKLKISPYIVSNIVDQVGITRLQGGHEPKKRPRTAQPIRTTHEPNSSLRDYIAGELRDSGFSDKATQLVREAMEAELKLVVDSVVKKALEALS